MSFTTVLLFREPADCAKKRLRVVWQRSPADCLSVPLRSRWRGIKYSAAFDVSAHICVAFTPYVAEVNTAATPPTVCERTQSKYSRQLRFPAFLQTVNREGSAAPNIYRVYVICSMFKTANGNSMVCICGELAPAPPRFLSLPGFCLTMRINSGGDGVGVGSRALG